MTVPEMQKAISRVRFLLADVKSKEEELGGLSQQFQRQLVRAANSAIYGDNSLATTLSAMSEVQERLENVEKMRKLLDAVKVRAEAELQALDLTDKIEHAKMELATLKAHQESREQGAENKLAKIQELERFIQEASIRAGQAITGQFEASEPGRTP